MARITADGALEAAEFHEAGDARIPDTYDYRSWQVGAANTGLWPGWTYHYGLAQNSVEVGVNPWGREDVMWRADSDGTTTAGDGGVTKGSPYPPARPGTLLRFSIWMKRYNHSGASADGRWYFGLSDQGGDVLKRSNAAVDTNPYFLPGRYTLAELPTDEWVLLVGHVWPAGSGAGANHTDSGVYRLDGTKTAASISDFVFADTTTAIWSRQFQYRGANTSVYTNFYRPRMDYIDGTEPTLQELLRGEEAPDTVLGGTRRILPTEQWVYPEFDETGGPVLDSAVWRVDAGAVTEDRLIDLSGGGRDAVFGAGAAKPIALPWDGEDYLCFPGGAAGSNLNRVIVGGSKAWSASDYDITMDMYLEAVEGNSYRPFYIGADHVTFTVYPPRSEFQVLHAGTGGTINVLWPNTVQAGRHTYRIVLKDGTAELFVDGASQGAQAFAMTPRGVAAGARIHGGSPYDHDTEVRFYDLKVIEDGALELHMNPSQVNADYSEIANGGAYGNRWIVGRADSGFKTVVVTRPTLLFGGAQYAEVADEWGRSFGAEPHTMIAAVRLFTTDDWNPILSNRGGNNTIPGVMLMRTNGNLTRYYFARDDLTGGSVVGGALQMGDSQVACGWDGAELFIQTSQGITNRLAESVGPGTSTVNLRLGRYGSGTVAMTGEFHAAVIFDRALTDVEVEQASRELLDGRVTATRPTMYARELREISLDTAVWRVDAGTLTDDGNGLKDLSGRGRDAVFGAGAASPIVLPWDGENYLYMPTGGNNKAVDGRTDATTRFTEAVITLDVELVLPQTAGSGLFTFGAQGAYSWSVSVYPNNNGRLYGSFYDDAGVREGPVSPIGTWESSARYHRITRSGLLVSYAYSADGETWTDKGVIFTLSGNRTQFRADLLWINYGAGNYSGRDAKWYGFTAEFDGQVLWKVRASDATPTGWPNTGSRGGALTIQRATSGFKAAVVTRPTLLFGGAQTAVSPQGVSLSGGADGVTVLVAGRQFAQASINIFLAQRTAYGGTGWQLFRSSNNDYYWQTTGPPGQHNWAKSTTDMVSGIAYRINVDGSHDSWLNGEYVRKFAAVNPPSLVESDQPLTIGGTGTDGNSYRTAMEFHAAAVFDRALTDREIARVSRELLGDRPW